MMMPRLTPGCMLQPPSLTLLRCHPNSASRLVQRLSLAFQLFIAACHAGRQETMLASPVSPSISLRSDETTSTSTTGAGNITYASPRHPAYLPPSSHAQASPSASSNTSNNTTSNCSRYTTTSQIERVNDVLVDKVLRQPRAVLGQGNAHNEQGSALKRLIAFLDGEDEDGGAVQQPENSSNKQYDKQSKEEIPHSRRHEAQSGRPANSRAQQNGHVSWLLKL